MSAAAAAAAAVRAAPSLSVFSHIKVYMGQTYALAVRGRTGTCRADTLQDIMQCMQTFVELNGGTPGMSSRQYVDVLAAADAEEASMETSSLFCGDGVCLSLPVGPDNVS